MISGITVGVRRVAAAVMVIAALGSVGALAGCSSDGDAAEEEAVSTLELAIGTEAELEDGLTVTVDSVDTSLVNYDGSAIVGIHVTYVNNGDSTADYSSYDWKGEDSNGAQESLTYYSEGTDELSSGTLAAGGTVSGNIYFKEGTVKLLYFDNMFDDEATASWIVE